MSENEAKIKITVNGECLKTHECYMVCEVLQDGNICPLNRTMEDDFYGNSFENPRTFEALLLIDKDHAQQMCNDFNNQSSWCDAYKHRKAIVLTFKLEPMIDE